MLILEGIYVTYKEKFCLMGDEPSLENNLVRYVPLEYKEILVFQIFSSAFSIFKTLIYLSTPVVRDVSLNINVKVFCVGSYNRSSSSFIRIINYRIVTYFLFCHGLEKVCIIQCNLQNSP